MISWNHIIVQNKKDISHTEVVQCSNSCKINHLKVMELVKFLYVINMYIICIYIRNLGLFRLLWPLLIIILKLISHSKHIHVCVTLFYHLFSSPFLSQLCFSFQFLFYFYLHPPIPLATFSAWWVYSCFSSLKGGTDEEKVSRSLRMLVSDWRHFCVIACHPIWSPKSQ